MAIPSPNAPRSARDMQRNVSTADFTYSGTELDALASAPNYYRAILSAFAPHLGQRVLEVGAGIGTFADHVLRARPDVDLTLLEPAGNNFPVLQQRFAGDPRVRVVNGYLEEYSEGDAIDSMVLVNVLEHVEEDESFLRTARATLQPHRGRILLFVPALPLVYGSLDREFEHYRRYTRPVLRHRLEHAGFQVIDLRYVNIFGVLPWFITGRILRRTTLRSRDVRLYDRWVIPWALRLERIVPPPFGQSLLAIGQA